MTNTIELKDCFRAGLAVEGGPRRTIANLPRLYFGLPARVVRGVICQRNLAAGIACTGDLLDGPKPASGMATLRRWREI